MGAFSAIASVAAPVIGGVLGNRASKKAGKASQRAAEAAVEERRMGLEQMQGNIERGINILNPDSEAGTGALEMLTRLLTGGGDPTNILRGFSPGFKFRQQQGEEALLARQRGEGMSLSGPALEELMRYNQDYASGEFDSFIRRLFGLSSIGTGARTNQVNLLGGLNSAIDSTTGSIANILTGAGQDKANSILSGSRSLTDGLTGGINNLFALRQNQQLLDALGGMGGGGGTPAAAGGGGWW